MSEVEVLSREKWLKLRQSHVTATDIGAIVGMNPWKSKLGVWLEKTGRAEPLEDNLAMWLGRNLQSTVLNRYEIEENVPVRHCGDTEIIISPEFRLAAATPDGVGKEDKRVVEAKAILGRSSSLKWGEIGTENAVPDMYFIQVIWQGMVLQQDVADIAVLLPGPNFRVYPIVRGRNLDLEAQLREEAERFWMDYVMTDKAPPVDASEEAAAWLARQFPRNTKQLLPATDEAEQIKQELLRAGEMLDVAKVQQNLAINQLEEIIAGDEGIVFGDGSRAKWSRTKDGEKVDYEAIAKHISGMISKVDYEAIVAKHTKKVDGIRKFYKPKEK
jgi:putative phage-type endonuclease